LFPVFFKEEDTMFHTRKKSALAMASLVVATALLTGCSDHHHHPIHHTPKPVAPVVPPVKENQISWLILALVPGVLLLVLLIGIHIGAKGVQDALTIRGRP
jgi:hypothetical protein